MCSVNRPKAWVSRGLVDSPRQPEGGSRFTSHLTDDLQNATSRNPTNRYSHTSRQFSHMTLLAGLIRQPTATRMAPDRLHPTVGAPIRQAVAHLNSEPSQILPSHCLGFKEPWPLNVVRSLDNDAPVDGIRVDIFRSPNRS